MTAESSVLSHRIVAAVSTVSAAVACSEVAATSFGLPAIGWLGLAVASTLTAAATGPAQAQRRRVRNVAAAIRKASLERSADELRASDVLSSDIDLAIPVETRAPSSSAQFDVASFAAAVANEAPQAKWVVTGLPGSGKSILLHRIAMAFNERSTGVCALVVPLATYDWTRQRFVSWLADEVATFAGVSSRDVERLIAQQRLFFLLDGLDAVPDREILERQGFPAGELPLFDRVLKRPSRGGRDPRRQLISRLNKLPGFVVSARTDTLSPDALAGLEPFSQATLCEIPAPVAFDLLRKRAFGFPESAFSRNLRTTVRRPLYLRLAAEVCGDFGLPPASVRSVRETKNWLWDRFLDQKLVDSDNIELDWNATTLRAWLTHYAAAAGEQDAVSFRRWPLLYGRRVRLALRGVKGAVSAALLVGLALLFVRLDAALLIAVPTFAIFLAAGEGAATRPMAPQRFGLFRFMGKAKDQWLYGASFAAAGALIGLFSTSTWATVLRSTSGLSTAEAVVVGIAMGSLLGFVVPTLYELHYVDDADLRHMPRRRTLVPTLESSSVIGVTAGVIVATALSVAFSSSLVFLAIPLCVLLAMVDTLGLPCAAVALWAAQRRGPVRIETFLAIAEEVGLARSYGQVYFLDHDEMKRYLAAQEAR